MLLAYTYAALAAALAALFIALSPGAYAYNANVTIVNDTTSHCKPSPSCYEPFQVNVAVGDTVTWTNHDNKTHTVTTGTANYGPQGIFDSGAISPGGSFTQFFGSTGKYSYYDKTDMWPSGVVVVSKSFSHAELSWVADSLKIESQNYTSGVYITKQIQNTGNADASSIIFTLKIKNQTSLFYNNLVKLDVPAGQSVPVTFAWDNPPDGQYQLFFEANAANAAGDMNANDDRSLDIISIPPYPVPQNSPPPLVHQNFTIASGGGNANVPEFGPVSYLVLMASLVSVIMLSKYRKMSGLLS